MLPRARTAAAGSLSSDLVVPLLPRRRVVGLPFGDLRSMRREGRFDTIGSRPYQPGDDPRRIDRYASARLSAVRDTDELVVREHHAEERVAVGLVIDEQPTMALHAVDLPWLHKPAAVRAVAEIVAASANRVRSPLVRIAALPVEGAERRLRSSSIVFFVSDFLVFPPDEAWDDVFVRDWDLVPIVLQDPTWEQSFPSVAGICLPLADPSGRVGAVRLTRGEVRRRKEENETRFAATIERLEDLGLEPVVVGTSEPEAVYDALLAWAEGRRSTFAWTA